MIFTGSDGDHIRQPGWNVGFAVSIVSPCNDSAVVPQRQTEIAASGHGNGVTQPGRHIALAIGVVAKCDRKCFGGQFQRIENLFGGLVRKGVRITRKPLAYP